MCYVHCSRDFDAALIILKGGSGRPIMKLEKSGGCIDRQRRTCDLQSLGWWRLRITDERLETYQEVSMQHIKLKSCKKKLKPEGKSVTSKMICADRLDTDLCEDGSGGPLFAGKKQVGIMSWDDRCNQRKAPRVYTSVPEVLPWIKQELASISEVIMLPDESD